MNIYMHMSQKGFREIRFLVVLCLLWSNAGDLLAQFNHFNDLWYKGVFPDSIIGYYHESPDMDVLDVRKVFHVVNDRLVADSTFYFSDLEGGYKNLEYFAYTYDSEGRLVSTRVFFGEDQDWFPWLLDSIYYSPLTGKKDSSKTFAFDNVSDEFQLENIHFYSLASNGWDSIVITVDPWYDSLYRAEFSFNGDYYSLTSYVRDQAEWIPVERDSFIVFPDKTLYYYVIRENGEWFNEFLDSIYLNGEGRWGKSRQYYINADGSHELVYTKEFYYPDQVSVKDPVGRGNISCRFVPESHQHVRILTEPTLEGVVHGFDMMGNLLFSQHLNSGDILDLYKYESSIMVLKFFNSNGDSCSQKFIFTP